MERNSFNPRNEYEQNSYYIYCTWPDAPRQGISESEYQERCNAAWARHIARGESHRRN